MSITGNETPTQAERPATSDDAEILRLREKVIRLQAELVKAKSDVGVAQRAHGRSHSKRVTLSENLLTTTALLKRLASAGVTTASEEYWAALKEVNAFLGVQTPALATEAPNS